MNNLEWLAQLLLSALFLVDGFIRIFAFRREPKPFPYWPLFASIRLPFEMAAVVAVVEIAGALALWVPANLWTPGILPGVAAAGLALLAVAGGVYHMRRREPSAPNLALFLLALMVILGRWPQ
jgi:hypothetical protein